MLRAKSHARYVAFSNALLLAAWFAIVPAHAAEPQSYRLQFTGSGDKELDATLQASSELASLRTVAPVSPLGLIARSRLDMDRFETVLESFGYYGGDVDVRIQDKTLTDPGLVVALESLPKDQLAMVSIAVHTGPRFHVRRINFEGEFPGWVPDTLTIKAGDPANAAPIVEAAARIERTLKNRGYAFAKVDKPVAYVVAGEDVLDIVFPVESGAQVPLGTVRISGLERTHEKILRRRMDLHAGEQYDPSKIERARQGLLALGVFSSVDVQLGSEEDAASGVPVVFRVRERRRHAINLNAAYSTDLGGSAGFSWTDRNAFGNAERLQLAASVINWGGSATNALGYDTSAMLSIPDFRQRDQSLQLSVAAVKQFLQSYDQTSVSGGGVLVRKLSEVWSASAGVTTTREKITQEGLTRHYTLLALPLVASYDSTHLASPLDDPVHGFRGSLSIAPTRSFGTPSANFVISQLKLAAYWDVGSRFQQRPGRSVLAVRSFLGVAAGAATLSLPPDQRFYAGGSATIRGFKFQSVGPQFQDGNPTGGTSIQAVGVEWRQRFGAKWGAAVFVDAGRVGARAADLPSAFRVGAGAGIRYYTPIGPIRLDVAAPISRRAGEDAFEVYVGLGQAF